MKLSVVVTTLNDREPLLSCLDALADHTPETAEIIVVNGPSSDGTTGAVRDRDDVDVLVEISERNQNVSRNAGLEFVTRDTVTFLDARSVIVPDWYDALETAFSTGADVVTGPLKGTDDPTVDAKSPRQICGRSVSFFHGENVTLHRSILDTLDGFDEYLRTGGARDCAHRVATLDVDVTWSGDVAVERVAGDDDSTDRDWGECYRSLSYRFAKNYGLRPTVIARTIGSAVRDGFAGACSVARRDRMVTSWFGEGTTVLTNAAIGFRDGIWARYSDRSESRNPNGLSSRHDRAVQVYDWR